MNGNRMSNGLDVTQHPKDIAAAKLSKFDRRPVAFDECIEQTRIARYIGQAAGHHHGPVEVPADPNVFDSAYVTDVLNVCTYVRDCGLGHRVGSLDSDGIDVGKGLGVSPAIDHDLTALVVPPPHLA